MVKKRRKPGKAEPDPLRGAYGATPRGRCCVVEHEPHVKLRDTEQVPLREKGGIEAFLRREVLSYASDAWYTSESVRVGCEICFARCFHKPKRQRRLEEIRAGILAVESESEGVLAAMLRL